MKKFKESLTSLNLGPKIILMAFALLVVVTAANYAVFMKGYSQDSHHALVEKAAAFTAVAEAAMSDSSEKLLNGEIDMEGLLETALEEIDNGAHYKDTRYYANIPVITGWHAALSAAEKEGLKVDVVALNARNPENAPVPGEFHDDMIRELTAQVKAGGSHTVSYEDEESNSVFFMRAIILDESCMSCHGDPAIYDKRDENGEYDGKDALGFRMEGWEVGDMHGAYEIQLPLDQVDAQVAGFFKKGMMFTIPLVVGGCFIFVFMIRRMLSGPLTQFVEVMKVAGEGNLVERVDVKSHDEMGMLAKWFNGFLENMCSMVEEVTGAAQSVAGASTQIAASADEMANGLQVQEQQTQQIAAAIEEMSQSVVEVAAKSSDATNATEESQRLAEEGGTIVESTVEEMGGIATEVNESAKTINALGEQSEKIGEIISVINDIADQTNLLALNAAIEAARAGEQGRGFAVVADEVRKLAERTTGATEEVSQSIRGIQNETRCAVERIEAGSERVSSGVELATQAGESLKTIVEGSVGVQTMVRDIAAAANEQSEAANEIARSIEGISSVTRQSSEGAGQAAEAAADLAHQAEQLQSLVSQFKTS